MNTVTRPKSFFFALVAAFATSVVFAASASAEVRVLSLKNQPVTGRDSAAVVKLYDGRVLVAAGSTGDGSRNTYDIFDPTGDSGAGSWTHHVGMNGGNWGGANAWWRPYFFNLGGDHHKVLLVAQQTGGTGYASSIYDPVDDTWTEPKSTGRGWASGCAQSAHGTIACSVNGLSVYNPSDDSWVDKGIDTGWWPSSMAGLADGKFLVVTNNAWPGYNQAYVFDSSDNSWNATDGAPTTLIEASMFRLPNGKILTVGGSTDSNNTNVANSYMWDPATGHWSTVGYPTGTATEPSLDHWGASQDSDGNVYYTAGMTLQAKYDAAAGQWDPTYYRQAEYEDPRGPAGAVPLKLDDGRVVIFGGGPNVEAAGWWRKTSSAYVTANVPVPTTAPSVSNAGSWIDIGTPVTLNSDAVWDTSGLTLNKRWQLCNTVGTCVDVSGADTSSLALSLDDFKAGYRTIRRIESYNDPNVGLIQSFTDVYVSGPAAPSASPSARVNFDPSGEYAAGTVLTRTKGTWTGHNISSVTSKWQRCGNGDSGWACVDLPDADTYTVTQSDIDNGVLIKYIETVDDDLNQNGVSEASGWIAPISPPSAGCCIDLSFPSSNNSSNVPMGQTVTANAADIDWNHTPDSVEYKWQRYDDSAGEWVDISGATGLTLSTAGFSPGDQLQLIARGTRNGDTGDWNRVANTYVDSNMWTPNGKFNWSTGNGRCTQTESLADLRTQGDCGDVISDARYYTSSGSHGDAFDGAYSTWIAKDSGNGDGTVYAQTLVDQGPNSRLSWKKAGDFGTDSWTSGTFGADDEIDGVKIGVRFRPSPTLDLVAKVVKLTNTTSDPVTRVVAETLNFGSDSSTTIHGQSSGGSETLDPAARWFVTADSSVGDNEPSDPVNTTVFGGPDAAVAPTTGQSDDDLGATFEVTIPAGETRYLVYFMGLGSMLQPASNDPSVAITNAQTLFANSQSLPSDLLVDVPVGDRGKVLNWSFVPPVVNPTVTFNGWGKTASGLAKITVGGPTGAQIEVSNYANFKSPVSIAVGRSGSIKTLATKLGAGSVTLYYRVKGDPTTAASTVVNYDFYRPFISKNSVRWAKTAKGIWNVHLIARDKTCPGCDPKLKVQVAYGKTKPSDMDPFPTRLLRDLFDYKVDSVIKAPTPPRWVRVADSQGNVSGWKGLVGYPAFPTA